MSKNYAKTIAMDQGGNPMQGVPPPLLAVGRYTSENAVASSVVTLTDNTTQIEVAAVGQAVALRWVASSDTQGSVISAVGTANYDHVIPANQLRTFVIPQERAGVSSIVGANVLNGCFKRVAWKSTGIGSVMAAEF